MPKWGIGENIAPVFHRRGWSQAYGPGGRESFRSSAKQLAKQKNGGPTDFSAEPPQGVMPLGV